MYSTNQDPYLDSTTGVLHNLINATNNQELDSWEASITSTVIASFSEQPIRGNFDLSHLKQIHKNIFETIYPWAGKLRTVEITKGTTRFANVNFLEAAANELFASLKNDNLLLNLSPDRHIQLFAHYYSELNVLHPFREGNGRTQRTFLSLLAAEAGYMVRWEHLQASDNINARVAAYNGDEQPLIGLLTPLIVKIA